MMAGTGSCTPYDPECRISSGRQQMDGLVGRNIFKSTLTCSKYRKHMHQFNSIWYTSKLQHVIVKWWMLYDIKLMCFQDFRVYATVRPFRATIHWKSFLKHTTSGNTWFYSTQLKLFAPEAIKHVNICCETLSFSLALASFHPGIVCVHMQKKDSQNTMPRTCWINDARNSGLSYKPTTVDASRTDCHM